MKLFIFFALLGIIIAQQLQCPPGFHLVKNSGSSSNAAATAKSAAAPANNGAPNPWFSRSAGGQGHWGNPSNFYRPRAGQSGNAGNGYYGRSAFFGRMPWGLPNTDSTSSTNQNTVSSDNGSTTTTTTSTSATIVNPQKLSTLKSSPSNITVEQVDSSTKVKTLFKANINTKSSQTV